MYIVRGGIFKDTSFSELESSEEKYGPYPSYDDALHQWHSAGWWQVDNCNHRLFIENLDA